MTRFFGPRRSMWEGLAIWRFALFAAVSMTIPYLLVARFLGPEFPSLFGGLIGLAIVVPAARAGFLIPRDETPWDFDPRDRWDSSWIGAALQTDDAPAPRRIPLVLAWMPYLLVAVLLVVTRLKALPVGAALQSVSLKLGELFGSELSHTLTPLYLPGALFVVVSLCTVPLHRMSLASYALAVRRSGRTLAAASVALVFAVPMVQVFINSGSPTTRFDAMPIALAAGVKDWVGEAWPLLATFIGGFGAAIAGSNTISNMTFSLFQFKVGEGIGVDPTWIVALQAVGGAAGNMICVHNVVAASAVVGLSGREGSVLRKTLFPFAYYALFAGSIGYAIVWTSQKGPVNLGSIVAAMILVLVVATIVAAERKRRAAGRPDRATP